jgi:3-oxoisoapionate decarboxylase
MRLGLSSYTYTWAVGVPGHLPARPLTAPQLLDRAARQNVPVVQIADNLPLHQLSGPARQALAAQAARLGIQVEVGTRGIAPGLLREYLSIAQLFGSPILRVVIDGPGRQYSPEAATDLLREQRAAFEEAGVILAIENHDRFPAATVARMVQDLGANWAGVCLDTANSLGALEGTATVLDILGPWTVNVHVKDVQVNRVPHMMGFVVEGRPAGQGQLGVAGLLASLVGRARDLPAGRELSAILELWTPPEPDLKLTIEKERRWAEESIRFLATLLSPGQPLAAPGAAPGGGELVR